jgi:phenylpropionate dioxygenase-like ring-hydroxylating dioxygenase large terminal subunit
MSVQTESMADVVRSIPSGASAYQFGRRRKSLVEVLNELQRCADRPLQQAGTLPAEVYTDEDFYQWELENIFQPEWICLAHVSQIPEPGDFLNIDLLGEPLIVVRGKDNQVRVLSRVCPHRAMDIMPPGFGYDGHGPAEPKPGEPGCGQTRLFLCPYHAWTFELDGTLKACPEMHLAEGFERDDFRLQPFRSAVWNGFIFINMDGQAAPLPERLCEMNQDFGEWNAGDMKLVFQREWECPFNWKVLVENFMESYHHLGAHSKTLQPTMPARDTWNEQEREAYIRCHLPVKESILEEWQKLEAGGSYPYGFPAISQLSESKKKEAGLFSAYPCFLLFVLADRVIWYRVEPLGPHRMKLLTTILVPAETTNHPDFARMFEGEVKMLVDFHLEDIEVCTAVQRGLYAAGCQRGRLSHLEMSVWLFQRYLAARARGTWPTLDRPAAPSQR